MKEKKKTKRISVNQLSKKQKKQIVRLKKIGLGTRKIAEKLNIGRTVVRSLLKRLGKTQRNGSQNNQPKSSKLDPFRATIQESVSKNLTTTRILREIRESGYQGQRTILADFVRTLRIRPTQKPKFFRRFETQPGEEMQFDWSPYRIPIAGRERIVHAFSMMLGYCRKTHVRFYPDERQPTLFEAHVHAFSDFGGICRRGVYDMMATVTLGRIGPDRRPLWHPAFADFALHYGFEPFLCRPRDPNRKGKDERFFWYLERDFVRSSSFDSFDQLNQRVRVWLDTVANVRVHGTTGRIPDEVFAEEKPFLIELPPSHHPHGAQELRSVSDDCVVSIRGKLYSVPKDLADSIVNVRLFAEHFEVFNSNAQVAFSRRYASENDDRKLILDDNHYGPHHPAKDQLNSSNQLENAFLTRFPNLRPLLAGLHLRMKGFYPIHLRTLIRLADLYGDAIFLQVASKVQAAKRFDSRAIQRILQRQHPLPEPQPDHALSAKARVQKVLSEVDSGSLDDYATLDSSPTSASTSNSEDES